MIIVRYILQDKDIMGNLLSFFDTLCGMFQMTIIVSLSMPILLVPMLPIIIFTGFVARKFLRVAREIKRLESVSKSPVFVLFSETIHGLAVIRTYQQEARFMNICFDRVDNMCRCFIHLWLSNRWLNIRMQLMGTIVCSLVTIGVVTQAKYLNSTSAGLLLIYSLEFTTYLVWLSRTHADVSYS